MHAANQNAPRNDARKQCRVECVHSFQYACLSHCIQNCSSSAKFQFIAKLYLLKVFFPKALAGSIRVLTLVHVCMCAGLMAPPAPKRRKLTAGRGSPNPPPPPPPPGGVMPGLGLPPAAQGETSLRVVVCDGLRLCFVPWSRSNTLLQLLWAPSLTTT